jgi:MarR family transcriptional regulator, transcriptional regulator for hemolysin
MVSLPNDMKSDTRFEDLLIRIDETMHRSIEKFKREALGKSRHSDVTIAQLAYIEAVFRLGRPTLTALAEALEVTKASASSGVHKLIRKELMKAEISDEDGRVIHISLTSNGRKVIEAEENAFREFAEGIRKALTKAEADTLRQLLVKVAAAGGA